MLDNSLVATKYIVLSASRMTDMPAFHPNAIIEEVERRIQKGWNIHTLVLWTKHPLALLKEPLYSYLVRLKQSGVQLYIQLTISGMGGEVIGYYEGKPIMAEPHVPNTHQSIENIADICNLTGNPNRILVRIDPILRVKDENGHIYSNLSQFETILSQCAATGIQRFTFSFLEKGIHAKVDKRFASRGFSILSPERDERERMVLWVQKLAEQRNVTIQSCCVPGLTPSACVDAELLELLHDLHLRLSHKQPKSRALCGCSHSVDLGGWPPKKCRSGCLYCYASPIC